MSKQELMKSIYKLITEYSQSIFWSKIYYPDNKYERAKFLISNLQNAMYYSCGYDIKNNLEEEESTPLNPQLEFIYLKDEIDLGKAENRSGLMIQYARRSHGILGDFHGESIIWTDKYGSIQNSGISHFYRENLTTINRSSFDSKDIFDLLLTIYCLKRSQSGDKVAQNLILNIFEKEATNIVKWFYIINKIESTEADPETLALIILRAVIFGVDAKNYIEYICRSGDLSATDKIELPSRRIVSHFLECVDEIPCELNSTAETIKIIRFKKGREEKQVGYWATCVLAIADPILALINSEKTMGSLYQPAIHGHFKNWLFGNWNFSHPTGAFHRRLNDYYKAKTEIINGKRLPRNRVEEFDDNRQYREEFEQYDDVGEEVKYLNKDDINALIKSLDSYTIHQKLNGKKAKALFLYGIRKNYKKGFGLNKQFTLQSLAKYCDCSVKTIQRLITDFEQRSKIKL